MAGGYHAAMLTGSPLRLLGALLAAPLLAGGGCADRDDGAGPAPGGLLALEVGGGRVEYLLAGIDPDSPANYGVLLLHGAAFSAATWQELGTISLLADAGFGVAAVNLPGKEGSAPTGLAPEVFLEDLILALGWEEVTVVSPSASGRYALPLAAKRPGRVRGLVAVAPVGIPQWLDALRDSPVPVLTVWSQDDRVVPSSHGDDLALAVRKARQLTFAGDVHPVYLEHTEEFHLELLDFLAEIEAR